MPLDAAVLAPVSSRFDLGEGATGGRRALACPAVAELVKARVVEALRLRDLAKQHGHVDGRRGEQSGAPWAPVGMPSEQGAKPLRAVGGHRLVGRARLGERPRPCAPVGQRG
eukprot:1932898-Pyramimonas_sp.AAC.1